MNESVHALLTGSIDYAGVFPPAKLPLKDAVSEFARHQSHDDKWMLGRFICPANEVEQFFSLCSLFPSPQSVSVVAQPDLNAKRLVSHLRKLANTVGQLYDAHGELVFVDTIELKLPPSVWLDISKVQIQELLQVVAELLWTLDLAKRVFCELPFSTHPVDFLTVLELIESEDYSLPVGLKLRTGGLKPAAFPSVHEVASFVAACRDTNVCWKATAGLHQPLRHYDSQIGVWHHGFLNLFAATVFAHAHKLPEKEIRSILEVDDPGAFRFDAAGLCWNDLRATTEQITAARTQSLVSFGSCSFDEPREGLRALGLL